MGRPATPGFSSAPRSLLAHYRYAARLPQRCDFTGHRIDLTDPREPAGARLVQSRGKALRVAAAMQLNKPLVFVAAVAFGMGMAERSLVQAADRPNILWLIAEDIGPLWPATARREVSTPNLDHWRPRASAYSPVPTPPPRSARPAARRSLRACTRRPSGPTTPLASRRRLPASAGSLPLTEWFPPAGYFTANVRELPSRVGFEGTAKTDWNFTPHGKRRSTPTTGRI